MKERPKINKEFALKFFNHTKYSQHKIMNQMTSEELVVLSELVSEIVAEKIKTNPSMKEENKGE